MAMTTTTTSRAANLCSCSFYHHHHYINPIKKKLILVGSKTCFFSTPYSIISSNARLQKLVPAHASNSQREEETSSSIDDTTTTTNGVSQEDWNYLWKLGAGSIAGAALIKYGSILFPDITRPNIIQALIMISTPVIVAIVLLIKQSQSRQH